jgi:acetoin utilization deacetylase AcuC-like enzyme
MSDGARGLAQRHFPLIWSDRYEVDIGVHVFPTAKYRLILDELLERGVVGSENILHPEPASWEEMGRVHSPGYLEKIRSGTFMAADQMLLELPFTTGLREASVLCCGGTTLTARKALEEGVAVHLGGGFHHAFRDHGEGFCLLNDVAVALLALLTEGEVERAAVVDLDVHQGNGTASIFADDARVFTFSMHQERNYPFIKPPGDLDLGLPDRTSDDGYLRALEGALDLVVGRHEPQVVVYLAGADPYMEDQLGGLALTKEGLEARDRMVLERFRKTGTGVAVVLAGGYARRTWDTVEIHRRTVEAARDFWTGLGPRKQSPPGEAMEGREPPGREGPSWPGEPLTELG